MPGTLDRYWQTLRHLRPVQVYGRLWFRSVRSRPDLSAAPLVRAAPGRWVAPARRRPSLVGPEQFLYLNQRAKLADVGWDGPGQSTLWRYNQHYFDDLNAEDAPRRRAWHQDLIANWIVGNPAATGVGWDPYPTSLRLVNWIKWAKTAGPLPAGFEQSLAVQARWLTRRLEWHLLGNHLFANAKALVFAGLFFEGDEAEEWLQRGLSIIERELDEQVLPDGGHFELSTMYHVLALEDVLDLVNIGAAAPGVLEGANGQIFRRLAERVVPMHRWLKTMCHPDGEIGFFNDAALEIAPTVDEIDAYLDRLGFTVRSVAKPAWLRHSGYARLQAGQATVLFDMASIGPDYLPAHAHADTLSFEMSIGMRRVIVNGGTSEYGAGPERQRQRSTAAHATVVLDGKNSSDVWSGFRVGRRARIVDATFAADVGAIRAAAVHDGYFVRGGARHHRRLLELDAYRLVVRDEITGAGQHTVHVIFPLGEGMTTRRDSTGSVRVLDGMGEAVAVFSSSSGASLSVHPSTWHPRFGQSVATESIVIAHTGNLPWMHETIIGFAS